MRPITLFLLLSTLTLASFPTDAADLRVGVASVDITPPPGTPMAGYYHQRGATGTHDPLLAKAIVLEQDGHKAALVTLDLIGTIRPSIEAARAAIEKEASIPGGNVMISATHSHTGPIFAEGRRYEVQRPNASGEVRPGAAEEFTQRLPQLIAAAAKQAAQQLEPAEVGFGTGRAEGLAFNRRFHMRDGSVGWNPGKLNPNIVRPAGPVDPEVQVAVFQTGARVRSAYVNFAMHLDTVGGLEYSADYPFTLSETLARAKGPDLLTLFAIGCAGDINHIDVSSGDRQKGHEEAARIGTILAAEVLRVMKEMATVTNAVLRVSSETVRLPLAPITEADLEEARELVSRLQSGKQPVPNFLEQVKAFQVLDVHDRKGQPWPVEVQVITLGKDLAWVSLPGEIFVELGLSIKAGSPYRQTMIATLANGSIGYIPTARAYSEGNYEVVSARCAEGSGELLVSSAIRQLRRLFAEAP